ncbi:MAG TPA: adenosylcobinamide-GDP ribazoletransferase [Candidatus Ruminococcus avistercoris]|nr:adenosylcobinamide-GDP ribazoletransferase [Candidatus Ruminococcus avistercoris]
MKKLGESFIIAFSMYSKIPMPRCDWREDNMSYAMCFWPLVGAVIGALWYIWGIVRMHVDMTQSFFAAILLLIPFLITGGIHLDGLLDTADAMSSWQTKERRLEILKDSHAGAFAVITCAVYFVLYFGICSQLNLTTIGVLAPGFLLSRALSAYAIVTFPKARKDGSVATFARGASTRKVQITMIFYILLAAVLMVLAKPVFGIAALSGAALVFAYYHHLAMKYFGGTTGDIAGWFLSVCELVMALVVAAVWIITGGMGA